MVSFRIVHDRETGRPKGFGFCEFADTSSVDLALRNLNGYEIHGRPLRVDSATGGDRSADEVQQFQMLSSSSAGGAGSMNIGVGGGPGGQMSSSSHHQINGNSSSNIGGQDGSQPSGQQQLQPQSDELNPYGPVPEPGKAPVIGVYLLNKMIFDIVIE